MVTESARKDPLTAALRALPVGEQTALTRELGARAAALGLTYLGGEGFRPIPVALPPVVVGAELLRGRAALARAMVAGVARIAAAVLAGHLGMARRERILGELGPTERALVERTLGAVSRLATVRVDMFAAGAGDRVLEVNATIPAMQGYSDIAAEAFFAAMLARFAPPRTASATAELAALLELNGSNGAALLASLVSCYRSAGGNAASPSIALVHRAADSQLGELTYLAARFRAAGHAARTVRAEDLSLDGAARCAVPAGDSETDAPFYPDILYRHIFARRVAPDSALGAILEHPERHHLYNPVAPHLEQKSVLAELSRCSVEADAGRAAGLEEPIARLVRAHLPWTRMLSPGPGTGPDGRPVAELIHFAGESPATLVVKKSWDFGGKGVFLGAEHGDEASRQRMRERFGRELSWPELVRACADEGGWVAQERVLLPRQTLAVATADGIVERQVFVDVSAYTNLGIPEVAYGGVCRASLSPIVNIQSGGGVVPLISERAAAELVSRCGLGQGRPSAGGGTRGDA